MGTEEELLMAEIAGRLVALGLADDARMVDSLWKVATAARDWLRSPGGKAATVAEDALTKTVENWTQTRIELFKKRTT